MKMLVLMIHHQFKQEAADIFRGLEQVQGFTFSEVEGHGSGSDAGQDRSLSARDKVVGYTPHVRADILLKDEDVPSVLTALKMSDLARNRHPLYWVTDVSHHGRL